MPMTFLLKLLKYIIYNNSFIWFLCKVVIIANSILVSHFVESNKGNCDVVQWLSRSELCVLVYLVSVRHSMHAGYMDKAHKYTEKALSQVHRENGEFAMYLLINVY